MRILGISAFLFLISPGDSSVQPGLKITALVVKTSVLEPNCLSLNAGYDTLYKLGQFTHTLMFGLFAYKMGIQKLFLKFLGELNEIMHSQGHRKKYATFQDLKKY